MVAVFNWRAIASVNYTVNVSARWNCGSVRWLAIVVTWAWSKKGAGQQIISAGGNKAWQGTRTCVCGALPRIGECDKDGGEIEAISWGVSLFALRMWHCK